MSEKKSYTVCIVAAIRPEMRGAWDGPAWNRAPVVELLSFRPEGSDHRPSVSARLLYDRTGIFGIFRVEDRYVKCIHKKYGDPVYKDSCVEFFVKPAQGRGYFNFEFNCGGAMLCSYIKDPARIPGGFRDFIMIPEEDGRQAALFHSEPEIVDPEMPGPVTWYLEFFIPFSLLEKYTGPIGDPAGRAWRANFYKCGDETSHPHWVSWSPVPALNFHLPDCFGTICFQESGPGD